MADGDTVITIKLKLDEGDAESSAATAGKDAGEAFRKAFEEATKGLDVSKSLKSDDLKKTFGQIGDEGKKTAKDLQDAFAKVQMPAAPRAPAVPAVHVPPRPRMPEDDRFERRLEASNTVMESFAKLVEGANPLLVAAPYLSLLGRYLMAGPDRRSEAEAATYARRLGRAGLGAGLGGLAGLTEDIGATGVVGEGAPAAERVATRIGIAGVVGADVASRIKAIQAERAALAAERAVAVEHVAPAAATVAPVAAAAEEGLGSKVLTGALAGGALGTMAVPGIGTGIGVVIGGITTAIGALAFGGTAAANAIKEMGMRAAETREGVEHLAKTLYPGLKEDEAVEELTKFTRSLSKTGLEVTSLQRGFGGLAVDITKRMPEIAREYDRAGDEMEEANIKVRDSQREVTRTALARQEADDAVIKSQSQLAIVEATGAERRQEQMQQAQLGVSGAQVGIARAGLSLREARVQAAFAPQEQALEDIQGPLTVKGAELGERTARTAVAEASLRYRQQVLGEAPDPAVVERLRLAKESDRISIALYNREQAVQRRKEAELHEQERQARPSLPERAQVGLQEAELGPQRAQLNKQIMDTNLKSLKIQQETIPLQIQLNEAIRGVISAQNNQSGASDKVTESQHGLLLANQHLAEERERNVKELMKTIEGEPGGPKLETAPPGAVRDALILAARERVKKQAMERGGPEAAAEAEPGAADVVDQLISAIQLAPEDLPRGRALVREALPGLQFRGLAGIEAVDKFLDRVRQMKPGVRASEQLDEEDLAGVKQYMAGYTAPGAKREAGRLIEAEAGAEFRARIKDMGTSVSDFSIGVTKFNETMADWTKSFISVVVGDRPDQPQEGGPGLGPPPRGPIPEGPAGAEERIRRARRAGRNVPGPELGPESSVLPRGATEAGTSHLQVHEVGTVKAELSGGSVEVHGTVAVSNMPAAAPAAAPGSAKSGDVTATEQARGGLIRGPGSGTSDSIPILASNGEYIIRQSRVAQLGVPFLDALNNRRVRFNLGGLVSLQHGGRVDSPSSLQSYDEASVQRALYKAWTDAHGTTPDPDSWAQVMRAKLNPETALDRFGNITEEGKRQAEQKRQGLAASLPPELTDQSFWARLARTGRTDISPGDPKSALAVASPGYMNELRRQMGLPPLLLPGMTADPQAQNAAAEAQRAQLMKVEQSIADQLRTDVWSRLAMTGSTMISPGDPRSAGIVASPKFMQQLRDSLGIKVPVDQDMSVDAQLARTGVAWGGTTHSIKIVATRLYQNILRERFGLPKIPGVGPPQAATGAPTGPTPGAPPGTAVPLTPRVPLGTPPTHRPPSGAPSTPGVPSGTPPTMQGKPGVPVISDDYLDHLQKNPGHIPQGPWQLYDTDTQKYIDMQPGKLLPVEPPAQTMWTIPTGPNGMFLTHDGVPAYRPPDNGMSLDYLETDKGKVFIPQGPWKIWDATRNTFIDMKPGLLQPVDPRAVMTPAPTPVPAVPVPGVTKPVAPPPRPDPNQPVLPTIKPSTAPEPPPPEPIQPTQPPGVTTPLPRPRPAEAPLPALPETVLPPRPAEPTRPMEDILKDLRENVIPSMIPLPKPAPGRLGRPEEQETPKDLPPSDLLEAPSRHGEAERKVREASINGGDDEGAWRGGLIRLSGGGLVPAMVSNGEYRMSPEAVSYYGVSLFDRLNGGGFAGGGSITMGRAQPPRPAGFPSGFSPIPEPGLIGEIANAMRNIGTVDPGVIRTITGVASGAGEVASTHRLDLVTSAGTFTVQAGAETLAAIQSSAIGGKLTSTGARPSWY